MPSRPASNELKILEQEFYKWRKRNPRRHYPRILWQRAIDLLTKFDLVDVAKSTGHSSSYLRRKIKKLSPSVPALAEPQFVEVLIQPEKPSVDSSSEHKVSVVLQDAEGMRAELWFQGRVSETFPLLSELFKR